MISKRQAVPAWESEPQNQESQCEPAAKTVVVRIKSGRKAGGTWNPRKVSVTKEPKEWKSHNKMKINQRLLKC